MTPNGKIISPSMQGGGRVARAKYGLKRDRGEVGAGRPDFATEIDISNGWPTPFILLEKRGWLEIIGLLCCNHSPDEGISAFRNIL